MSADDVTGPRSTQARATAVAVLLAVGIAGVAGGVVLDRTVLMPKTPVAAVRGGPNTPSDRIGRSPNPDMRRRFSERMAKDLGLTPEQSVKVDAIMKHQFDEMRKASELVRPRIDSLSRAAQLAMDSVLTPEQREKVKELRARGRDGGREGGRDGGRGGRGRDTGRQSSGS